MLSLEFVNSEYEYCLYVKATTEYKVYILLCVDDLLLAGTSIEEVEKVKAVLKKHFKMKNLGYIKQFLGRNISQNLKKKKIVITQSIFKECTR